MNTSEESRGAYGAAAGKLPARPFPHGDWADPGTRLDELYLWVESGALSTVRAYLAARRAKRRAARSLRAAAALSAAAGGTLLLGLAAGGSAPGAGSAGWGYLALLALLAAVACVAADRGLGLTAGWIRDVATAGAVQRRLTALQYDWAAEDVREVLGPAEGTAAEAAHRRLALLRGFGEDVSELVRAETADWMAASGACGGALAARSPGLWDGPPRPSRGAESAPPRSAPGGRGGPGLPRQRPGG